MTQRQLPDTLETYLMSFLSKGTVSRITLLKSDCSKNSRKS